MRVSGLGRRAIISCVTVAMLAGCGGPQPPTGAQGAVEPAIARRTGSWMAREATSEDLVYIMLGSSAGVYSLAGEQVGELKGFDRSEGICSDAQGNVWVTYGDGFLEYAHGGTVPIAELYLQYPYYPVSCAVDPTTGDVAAAEDSEDHGSNVAVYQNIYGTPQTYADADIFAYGYLGYDDQGDLFVNGMRNKTPEFAELPAGGSELGALSVDEKFGKIGGLQWDGQYLALGDSVNHVVYQMSVSDGHATTEGTTHFFHWRKRFKSIVSFAIGDGVIIFPYFTGKVGYWDYPQGGRAVHQILVNGAGGLAISVAPSDSLGGRK
jgi:hypothetical protein